MADSSDELNQQKQTYIERIGSECVAEDIPFFLEILAYDEKIADAGSAEYAKVKPHKGYWCHEGLLRPTLQHRCLESGSSSQRQIR